MFSATALHHTPRATPSGHAPCRIPADLHAGWHLADGTPVLWRPVLPRDHAALARFIAGLSPGSRRARFPGGGRSLPASRLADLSDVDFEHHIGFVITVPDEGGQRLIGEARFIVDGSSGCADIGLAIADGWQRHGLGTRAVLAMAGAAARRGLRWLRADVAEDNMPMLTTLRHCGFTRTPHPDLPGLVQLHLLLLPPFPATSGLSTPVASHYHRAAPSTTGICR